MDWKRELLEQAAAAEARVDALRERWARRFGAGDPWRIVAYRGVGNGSELHLQGRVLRGLPPPPGDDDESLWEALVASWQRLESDEVAGASLELAIAGVTTRVRTDAEGYYTATVRPQVAVEGPWVTGTATLLAPAPVGPAVGAAVTALVPPPGASFAVISDVDDTVLVSDATHLLRAARHLLLEGARTRLPFAGVAELYQALQRGPSGAEGNPIAYLSSSPWNLYDLLSEFLAHNAIPAGPLFLRDYGLDPSLLAVSDHHEHKLAKIEFLMGVWPHLPFVLLGDSGQQDPEIYVEAVRRFPGRVRAVYIRDVAGDGRDGEVARLAAASAALGVPLVAAAESSVMAAHARAAGLIRTA